MDETAWNQLAGRLQPHAGRCARRAGLAVTSCEAYKGGGVALFSGGALSMAATVSKHNTARSDGGGIINDGTVTVNEGSFLRNSAALSGAGGGIRSTGLNVTLNAGSTVARNSPDDCEPAQGTCT